MILLKLGGWEAFDGGLTVAFVGIAIVFTVLAFLAIVFNLLQKSLNINLKHELKKLGSKTDKSKVEISDNDLNVPGDTNAAISLALYMYFNELHIEESGVITIKKVEKRYSPWSSKIYGLNNLRK